MTHNLQYGKTYDIQCDSFSINGLTLPENAIFQTTLSTPAGSAKGMGSPAARVIAEKRNGYVTVFFDPESLNGAGNAVNTATIQFNETLPAGFRPGGIINVAAAVNINNNGVAQVGNFVVGPAGQLFVTANGLNPYTNQWTAGQACSVFNSACVTYFAGA
jgi:hypothetical protein